MHTYDPMSFEEWSEKTKFPRATYRYNYKPDATWHLLYEHRTKRPVAICRYLTTINDLLPYVSEVSPWYNISSVKNRYGQYKISEDFSTKTCWMFQYNSITEVFEPARVRLQFHNAYRYAVLQEKAGTIDYINEKIENQRLLFSQDVLGQTEVNNLKILESSEILKLHSTGTPIDLENFPIINELSQFLSSDVISLATEILTKEEFKKSTLTQTEQLRLKYFYATIRCKEIVEVKAVLQDFIDETRTWPVL